MKSQLHLGMPFRFLNQSAFQNPSDCKTMFVAWSLSNHNFPTITSRELFNHYGIGNSPKSSLKILTTFEFGTFFGATSQHWDIKVFLNNVGVQSFTLAASNNRDQMPWSLVLYSIVCSHHIHVGGILCAHPVRGVLHIQRNANQEVATMSSWHEKKVKWQFTCFFFWNKQGENMRI